jgi:hypothetical protein
MDEGALLPPGYEAQPAWGFRDSAGVWYAFIRVYAPPAPGDRRGAVCPIDEQRSHWSATRAGPDGRPLSRILTFAGARARSPGLTFAGFGSPQPPPVVREWMAGTGGNLPHGAAS